MAHPVRNMILSKTEKDVEAERIYYLGKEEKKNLGLEESRRGEVGTVSRQLILDSLARERSRMVER